MHSKGSSIDFPATLTVNLLRVLIRCDNKSEYKKFDNEILLFES